MVAYKYGWSRVTRVVYVYVFACPFSFTFECTCMSVFSCLNACVFVSCRLFLNMFQVKILHDVIWSTNML